MDASDIMSLIGSAQGVGQVASLFQTLTKAKLLCKEYDGTGLIPGAIYPPLNELEFQFNPSTLKLTREPDWDDGDRLNNGAHRAMKFGGNRADRLIFQVLLDETEYRGSLTALTALMPMAGLGGLAGFLFQNRSNTLATMQGIYNLTMPYVKIGGSMFGPAEGWRPPLVVFKWGGFEFSGVVDDLDFEMLLFDMDGNPRRVMVDFTLKGRAFCNLSKADELLEIMDEDEFKEMATRQKNASVLSSMGNIATGGGQSGL